ncbi:hypothetical protein [Delftia acidovorans]|uniref:hypothetical protein n=1 Tax=Delftia acidovorans TaxID=80866 RepID=UPI001AD01A3E|nr:hypothetical protein [Delftia acidovorans]MBN9323681.1 hypothetical protein [Delftia acidovorans]
MSNFENEAELCKAFIDWLADKSGDWHMGHKVPVWTAYAETAGWDILLVADDGTQVGVQAKMQFNMKLLAQSVGGPDAWNAWSETGPDFRAVLVPKRSSEHEAVCAALGLDYIHPLGYGGGFDFELQTDVARASSWKSRRYWCPGQREKLPEFVPDVVAGAPAPMQLTPWKVQALRLMALLELRGYVTRQDFKAQKLDHRAWTQGGRAWLAPGAAPGQFVRGPGANFDRHHPIVYAQVLEEMRATFTPPAPAVPAQGAMFTEPA